MNKQAILDVLNSLEVVEINGGEDSYIFVENSVINRKKLIEVNVTEKEIYDAGDDETFCILALAFNGNYADYVDENFKLALYGPIDDELRNRVLNGEGTAIDAERPLKALEPHLFGKNYNETTEQPSEAAAE